MKNLKKSRVAVLIGVLVLVVALSAVLVVNAFAAESAITTCNLILTDGIEIVVEGTLGADAEGTITYSFAGGSKTVTPEVNGEKFAVTIPVSASQMNEEITIAIDGTDVTGTTSIKAIAELYLAAGDEEMPAQAKAIINALVHYGAAVSAYNDDTAAATALLATTGLSAAPAAPETIGSTYVAGDDYASLTMSLTGLLNFGFKPAEGETIVHKVNIVDFFKPITEGDVTASPSYYAAQMKDHAEAGEVVQALVNFAYAVHTATEQHTYTYSQCTADEAAKTMTYACVDCGHSFAYGVLAVDSFDNGYNKHASSNYLLNLKATTPTTDGGYASVIPGTVSDKGTYFELKPAGKVILADSSTLVCGFDLAMPEGGFPVKGVKVIAKFNGAWDLTGDMLTFMDNAVYYYGTKYKIADLKAGEWHNFTVKNQITNDGTNIISTTTIYMDGEEQGSYSRSKAISTFGTKENFDWMHNGNYIQLCLISASEANQSGYYIDNIYMADAIPHEKHAASETDSHNEYFEYTTCKVGGEPFAKNNHSLACSNDAQIGTNSITYQCTTCSYHYTISDTLAVDSFDNNQSNGSTGSFSAQGTTNPSISNNMSSVINNPEKADKANNHVVYQIQSNGKVTLSDKYTIVLGFDLAMPEGGFPVSGAEVLTKIGNWSGLSATPLMFKGGAVYWNGTTNKIMDIKANEFHNYVVKIVLFKDGTTAAKITYTIYVDGVQRGTFTKSNSDLSLCPDTGWNTSNYYVQVKFPSSDYNEHDNTGFIIDNIFIGNAAPVINQD